MILIKHNEMKEDSVVLKNNVVAFITNLLLSVICIPLVLISAGPEGISGLMILNLIFVTISLVYIGYSKLDKQGSALKNLASISVIGMILLLSAVYRSFGGIESLKDLANWLDWHTTVFDMIFGILNSRGEIITSIIPTVLMFFGLSIKK